jgi:predicted MPP superfamily phosphohydrolase
MAKSPSLRHYKKRRIVILSVLIPILLGCIIWVIHSNTVPTLTEVAIPAEGLPRGFDGFRIVQVSDLHDAEFGKDHEKTLDLIRKAEPDVIFLTGDMIDKHGTRTDVALTVAFAEQAVEIAPCYYVTGNHEGAIPAETYAELEEALLSLGVTVLHGEAVTLERGGDSVTLAGIDSPAFGHGESASPDLSELCGTGYTILLAHHPDFIARYAEAGADLVFSGHVHGGQFRIPFLGGLYVPNQGFFPEYDAGLYTEGDTNMFISRGMGNSAFPFRINNRPEIVVIELESE